MTALADLHVPRISQVHTVLPPPRCSFRLLFNTPLPQEELVAFYESHFSLAATADFQARFTGLRETAIEAERGDAYSETQDVQYAHDEEPANEGLAQEPNLTGDDDPYDPGQSAPAEEGEIADDGADAQREGKKGLRHEEEPQKKRRRKKKNNRSNNMPDGSAGRSEPPKPDLRKRTWDVVDTGLGSLDYDGAEQYASALPGPPQRRRVQYGDD